MRHGEKQGGDLSVDGQLRAKFVPEYFKEFRPDGVPFPTHIISMKPQHETSSRRCIDTLIPMMRTFCMTLHIEIKRDDVEQLVNYIQSLPESSVVLVCWEHHSLVFIARALGFPVMNWNETPFTINIDTKRFDILWKIDEDLFESFMTFSIEDDKMSFYLHPLRQRFIRDQLVASMGARWTKPSIA
jgi:hypothetical protein